MNPEEEQKCFHFLSPGWLWEEAKAPIQPMPALLRSARPRRRAITLHLRAWPSLGVIPATSAMFHLEFIAVDANGEALSLALTLLDAHTSNSLN